MEIKLFTGTLDVLKIGIQRYGDTITAALNTVILMMIQVKKGNNGE